MNKNEIKQIILEEIEAALKEMGMSPEIMAADSRPDEDDDITPPGIEDMSPDPIFGPNPSFVEEDELSEMARTANVFSLAREASIKDVLQFMQRVNDVLKTYKSPGQKRPKKRFTPEEMKALAKVMLQDGGFTSKDIIASTSYSSPAQANKFLAALEQKGLIKLTSQLKKSMEPERDPNAPETRGRKAKSAEFDVADDPTMMDFGDFEDLDLGDIDALEENNNTMTNLEKYIKKVIKERKSLMQEAVDQHQFKSPETIEKLNQLSNDLVRYSKLLKKPAKMNGFNQNNHLPSMFQSLISNIGRCLEEIKKLEGSDVMDYDSIGGDTIREGKNPLSQKMKEIENQGRIAALETKLAAVAEMIEETNGRLTRIDEDNEFADMMDKNAVKEVRKQLKELEKAQAKLQKEYDKAAGGRKKTKVVDELDAEETRANSEKAKAKADKLADLANRQDALDQEAEDSVEEVSLELNESILRMQKLAGLITESEIQKKPSLKENLDPKTTEYLSYRSGGFMMSVYSDLKAGEELNFEFKGDANFAGPDFGRIGNEYITFDENDALKYSVRKLDGDNYEIKVDVKKDLYF